MFSKDEVQSGVLGRVRRARALVYLIEQEATRSRDRRVALTSAAIPESGLALLTMVDADPELMRRNLPGEADTAFVESFRNARRHTASGPIRSIEANTSGWKVLLPEHLELRAEVLHQLALRHEMPVNRSASIAKAFGVGTPEFDEAYLSVTGHTVDTAFGAPTGFLARWRARRAAS